MCAHCLFLETCVKLSSSSVNSLVKRTILRMTSFNRETQVEVEVCFPFSKQEVLLCIRHNLPQHPSLQVYAVESLVPCSLTE